jgi:hypothetical protein
MYKGDKQRPAAAPDDKHKFMLEQTQNSPKGACS